MRRASAATTIVLLSVVLALPAAGDLTERRGEPPSEQPPEACGGDWVSGVWRARRNYERDWNYQVTLHIARTPGDRRAIQGRIVGQWWSGPRGAPLPPPCYPRQIAFQVTQRAAGLVEDDRRISFRASSFRIDRVMCGDAGGYSLDHFVGTIDPDAPILRAVNNDGGAAVDEPEVFRRIRCR